MFDNEIETLVNYCIDNNLEYRIEQCGNFEHIVYVNVNGYFKPVQNIDSLNRG